VQGVGRMGLVSIDNNWCPGCGILTVVTVLDGTFTEPYTDPKAASTLVDNT